MAITKLDAQVPHAHAVDEMHPQCKPAELGALECATDIDHEVGHAVHGAALAHEPEEAVPAPVAGFIAAVLVRERAR